MFIGFLIIATLFIFCILYLVAFSSVDTTTKQVFIQLAFAVIVVSSKEALFISTKRNNIILYYVEFTSSFFTFMALPSVVSTFTFSFNVAHEAFGILYQVLRLSKWWYYNVEQGYFAKFRNFVGSGGILEELVAIVAVKSFKVFRIRVLESSKTQNTEPEFINSPSNETVRSTSELDEAGRINFQKHICRNIFLVALAKSYAPLSFCVIFSFIFLGYNKDFYPWKDFTDDNFNRIVVFAIIAFVVYGLIGILSLAIASIIMRRNACKQGIIYVKKPCLDIFGIYSRSLCDPICNDLHTQ